MATQNIWIIESDEAEPYRSTGFLTRSEARFRLREIADEPYYNGRTAVRQADDFFVTADGATYRVKKWCSITG